MALTLWSDVERGLTNTELDTNFSELAAGGLSQTASDNRPLVKPSLNLDFTKGVLDPRVTFTRASTATYFGADGLLKTAGVNEPRFEYDPVTRQPKGLLIEEQRTNLLLYSEQLDNAAWTKNACTISSGISAAGITLQKIVEDTASSTHGLSATHNFGATAAVRTISFFAKSAEKSTVVFNLINSDQRAVFNLATGQASVAGGFLSTASMQSLGGGLYRCSATTVGLDGSRVLNIFIDSVTSYVGNGTSGVYLGGIQLEAGTFPTSYIPTTTAQVTRSADAAAMAGINFSSWFRHNEGTLYAEFVELYSSSALLGNSGGVSLNTNSTVPCIEILPRSTDVVASCRGVGSGGVSSIEFLHPTVFRSQGSFWQFAMSYTNDPLGTATAASLNGTSATNTTKTANPMVGINQLEVGKQVTSGTTIGTRCFRTIKYYPAKFTASQLQELTK